MNFFKKVHLCDNATYDDLGSCIHSNDAEPILGEKIGTITVSVYREKVTGSPIFFIKSDNDDVLPVSYVIEDTLKLY